MTALRARVAVLSLPIAASLALTTACGGSDNAAAQSTTSASSSTGPSTPQEQPQSQGRPFTANPAIVGANPIPFDSWSKVAPDRIAVNFQIGSPECYGVDAATTETDKTVTVALRSGTLPEAVGRMCTMIAVFGTLEIQLKQPLGNRKVLSAT